MNVLMLFLVTGSTTDIWNLASMTAASKIFFSGVKLGVFAFTANPAFSLAKMQPHSLLLRRSYVSLRDCIIFSTSSRYVD